MNKNVMKLILAGAGGAAIGFTGGWLFAQHQAKKVIAEGFDRITKEYEDSLERITKTGPYSTVEGAAEILLPKEEQNFTTEEAEALVEQNVDILENYRDHIDEYGRVTLPGPVDGDEFEEETEDSPEDGFDDDPEPSVPQFETVRDPNGPYLISIDEYMEEGETPYTKTEMTYFAGDDVLIDSQEKIIPNIGTTIGEKNLDRFGEGTTDKDQMYIRNERLEMDIEVTRHDGTYTRVVLGVPSEDEIRRSMIKPPRMRDGDGD